MNFEQFESIDNTRERKGGYTMIKEQSFDNLKYRKSIKKVAGKDGKPDTEIPEGRFYVAKARFNGLGLANKGFHSFHAPDGSVVLAVTSLKDAQFLRDPKAHVDKETGVKSPGKKSTSFTSPKLEAALENLKVINTTLIGENQFVDMTEVDKNVTIKGVACFEVFTLAAGVAKVKEETVAEKLVAATPVAKAAAPQAAPAVAGGWE